MTDYEPVIRLLEDLGTTQRNIIHKTKQMISISKKARTARIDLCQRNIYALNLVVKLLWEKNEKIELVVGKPFSIFDVIKKVLAKTEPSPYQFTEEEAKSHTLFLEQLRNGISPPIEKDVKEGVKVEYIPISNLEAIDLELKILREKLEKIKFDNASKKPQVKEESWGCPVGEQGDRGVLKVADPDPSLFLEETRNGIHPSTRSKRNNNLKGGC